MFDTTTNPRQIANKPPREEPPERMAGESSLQAEEALCGKVVTVRLGGYEDPSYVVEPSTGRCEDGWWQHWRTDEYK